ncbi:MAG: ion transporter [Myxococcota bacterium]
MVQLCQKIADNKLFQNFVTVVILAAGVLVGIETYPSAVESYGEILHVLDAIILWIFVAEIVIKMVAAWPRPWRFFYDPWNIFDFVIVAAAFLPFAGSATTVLRLLRLLRVLRLVRALPKLQLLVGALLKSIPSMGYVSILLMLLFYVYAVAGVFMWGQNDPIHFENLQIAFVSLFRAVTLEDWTDLMYIQMYGCENYGYGGSEALCTASSASPVAGAVFFISFVLFGTMIILNLFIGVILSGMDEAQAEADDLAREDRKADTIESELKQLEKQLGELQGSLARVRRASVRSGEGDKEVLGVAPAPAE